jgi:dipeptidyl aminopeptidase/acylaminoacyl peptidase
MIVYPGEGHGLRQRLHKFDAARRKIAWFDRFLRPGNR